MGGGGNGKAAGNGIKERQKRVLVGLVGGILHPGPRRAVVVGLGTGQTAGWLAEVPSMDHAEVVELEPGVIEFARLCAVTNHDVVEHAKVRITGATVNGLEAGVYYWRVSSMDSKGRESLFSPFSVFRLNHDQTPPLLAMSDPIVLQEGQVSKVYLAGAVEPGSQLTVNGQAAPLAADGTFRMFTALGSNVSSLSIRAVDPAGNVLSQVRELR